MKNKKRMFTGGQIFQGLFIIGFLVGCVLVLTHTVYTAVTCEGDVVSHMGRVVCVEGKEND
jgi:hypothetical protein